jgi:CRISPR/Cas system-associated exonuclease Cas4 (RecB family)
MTEAAVSDTPAPLLQPGYLFSQHSLNTFVRCPRRFLLKYVDRQPWPMPEEEDPRQYLEHLARGRTFHQWLARAHLNLAMEPIVAACEDPQLREWWAAAKQFDRDALPAGVREAELPVVIPLGNYRLYARYDLIALDPGTEAIVVDWKTLEALPSERTLRSRMQTRVYLYTLVAAGHILTEGVPIHPANARMVYWFANYPTTTTTIRYSAKAYRQDGQDLVQMANQIAHQPREAFVRTDDSRQCTHCSYRSLCQREEQHDAAERADWLDEDIDLELELENVPELDY